jgi:hypothetical protein
LDIKKKELLEFRRKINNFSLRIKRKTIKKNILSWSFQSNKIIISGCESHVFEILSNAYKKQNKLYV